MKTLSDKLESKVNFFPRNRTVAFLRGLKPPAHLASTTPRQKGVEMTTYRVRVALVRATVEDDHDIHLVVATPSNHAQTMIVEFPDTNCTGAAASPKKAQMKAARSAVFNDCPKIGPGKFTELSGSATITGVGFWDSIHGQSGVAPNGIELHPALSFSGTCKPASPPPSGSGPASIAEIFYNSPGPDDGSNASLDAEWVLIRNPASSTLAMKGWTLRDAADHVFTFPQFTLAAGHSVKVHTGSGSDSSTDLYWGSGSYIWNNDGDTATLKKSGGTTADRCSYSDPSETNDHVFC